MKKRETFFFRGLSGLSHSFLEDYQGNAGSLGNNGNVGGGSADGGSDYQWFDFSAPGK